jgi:hypothetical protein
MIVGSIEQSSNFITLQRTEEPVTYNVHGVTLPVVSEEGEFETRRVRSTFLG